jgi:hypothetical protein
MRKGFVIYPFFFAIFPALFIYSHNIGQILGSEVYLPIVIIVILTAIIWLALNMWIKNIAKSAVIVSFFFIWFFSYGHIYGLLNEDSYLLGKAAIIVGQDFFTFLWTVLFILIAYLIIKRKGDFRKVTGVLTIVIVFLTAVQIFTIFAFILKAPRFPAGAAKDKYDLDLQQHFNCPPKPPNIYYIILDGYARADTLKEVYKGSNDYFLRYLSKKKFYIANKSVSNYCQTILSLASSLNCKYLEEVGVANRYSQNRVLMFDMLQDCRVIHILKMMGYKIVDFSSGYKLTYIKDADVHISSRFGLPEFQCELLDTTPVPYLLQKIPFLRLSDTELHRRRINFIFDYLDDVLKIRAPIFAFVHILSPHPPFVFAQDGSIANPNAKFLVVDDPRFIKEEEITREEYRKEYLEQLIYITKRIEESIEQILSNGEPSIIILQSDHGPGSGLDWNDVDKSDLKERFGILNAYYFPDADYKELYQTITPVNTFRLIFNHFFGAHYELLPDNSYFSSFDYPYKFIDISKKVN